MRPRGILAVIGVSLAAGLAGASAAGASVTLGQTAGAADSCGSNQSFVQASTAGAPSYVAPSSGVIVQWDYLSHAQTPSIKLKVYRLKTSPTVWTLTAQSAVRTGGTGPGQVHANSLNTFSESPGIPIEAGEYLGLTGLSGSGMACLTFTGSNSDSVRVCCSMGVADTSMGDNTFPGQLDATKIGVSAVVEPDADGDHFGDETQDSCPTDPAVQSGPCPVDVAITKTASPEPGEVGRTLTYTITATNLSTMNPAADVAVNDTLPAGVTFKSASTTQGLCSGTAIVACSIGVLPAGASATVTIAVTPNATGPLANTATGSASGDTNAANDSATATSTVGADRTRPVLSRTSMKPRAFRVGKKKGTTFKYTLSEPARVVFTIARKHGKRFKKVGAFSDAGREGANTRAWSGKIGKRSLKPGRYRATVTARDKARNASKSKRLRFKIVRG